MGVQWVNGAGVLEVWKWVLDGVSFVLGEKRAKTARELFHCQPPRFSILAVSSFISGGSH